MTTTFNHADTPLIIQLTGFKHFDLAVDGLPAKAVVTGSNWSRTVRFEPNTSCGLLLSVAHDLQGYKASMLGLAEAISSSSMGDEAGLRTLLLRLSGRVTDVFGKLSLRQLQDVKKAQTFKTGIFKASVLEFNAMLNESVLEATQYRWKFIICYMEQTGKNDPITVEAVAAGPHDEMMRWRPILPSVFSSIRAFDTGGYIPDLAWGPAKASPAAQSLAAALPASFLAEEVPSRSFLEPPTHPAATFVSLPANLPPVRTGTIREWARGDRVTLAIVFTDIVNSTRLGQLFGDETMRIVRQEHFDQSRRLIDKYGGYEVKTIGDSFMVLFRSVDAALDYVVNLRNNTGHSEIVVRAGLHIGAIDIGPHDVDGSEVSYAARVTSSIEAAEIWVSSPAKRDLDNVRAQRHARFRWQRHEEIQLKSFEKLGPQTLWSLEAIY